MKRYASIAYSMHMAHEVPWSVLREQAIAAKERFGCTWSAFLQAIDLSAKPSYLHYLTNDTASPSKRLGTFGRLLRDAPCAVNYDTILIPHGPITLMQHLISWRDRHGHEYPELKSFGVVEFSTEAPAIEHMRQICVDCTRFMDPVRQSEMCASLPYPESMVSFCVSMEL